MYECERPRRQERRRGKSLIDAASAARKLIAGEGLSLPRGDGRREGLRLLLLERRGTMQARNAALNQLSALGVTAPEHVRECLGALSKELAEAERARTTLVAELAPEPLEECGAGPVYAAQLLVSSGDPGRMRSQASSAALTGTSPVDASSGKQRHHRLNRGGDRQLNWALHIVALQRIRHHPETNAYYQRPLAPGKTAREARRRIKRALAHHF